MRFRDLLKPSKPKTLAARVNSVSLEGLVRIWEALRGKDGNAKMVFGWAIAAEAGEFCSKCLPRIRPFLGKTNDDLVAFEALAFSAFALRAFYPKEKQRRLYNGLDSESFADEAFRLGGLACTEIAALYLGDGYPGVFSERVFEYRRVAKAEGMQGAVGNFTRILFSCKGARTPQLKYGQATSELDLEEATANMGVLAFATTMPMGMSSSLKEFVDQKGAVHL